MSPRTTTCRGWTILVLGILASLGIAAQAAPGPPRAEATRERATERVLVLGPLPGEPKTPPGDSPLAPGVEPVPEIPLDAGWPPRGSVPLQGGESATWREVETGPDGVELAGGVFWIAARLTVDRFAEVSLTVRGAPASEVFVDGDELSASATHAARGTHTVLARVVVEEDPPVPVALSASTAGPATSMWHLDRRVPPARYQRFGAMRSTTALAVAPGGELIARGMRVRRALTAEGEQRWMDVLDASGRVVAGHLGGPGATPLGFSPDGGRLALTLPGSESPDLAVWHAASGRLERVAAGERQLQAARWSPDGGALLVISARGARATAPRSEGMPARRVHPRERVPDYRTGPHLHWVDVNTGARRRLTAPGDFVLDDAVVGPSGRTVFYARTVPREEHPWFETEIRRIDLAEGTDRRIDTFRAGWEIRPSGLTVSPSGDRLAFVGPPDEVSRGASAHNVLHTRLYEIDLETGDRRALALDPSGAWSYLRAPALSYLQDGSELIATRLEGSRIRLVRAVRGGAAGWGTMPLAGEAETIERVALSPGGGTAAVVSSSRTRPAELTLVDVRQGGTRTVERPNADIASGWRLSEPVPVPAASPGGDPLDAWYYPPSFGIEPRRVPLAVYYYGGATPTLRRFVPMHQFLAANGYGVLVVNPRGAAGYSPEFADEHAGDWGPSSSKDVLATVDRILEQRPEINPAAIDVLGGSYGGFVTSYLVTRTDRFGAAVSMYGISDIATYWARGAWGWTYGDMASAGALPWEDPELFVERSPFRAAGRIETPLLLLHGEADVNVPLGESEQLYTALAVQGKPVELVTFPEERHGISGTFENRAAHRTMILEWFDRHLRDQPEAWRHRWDAGSE